MPRDEKLYSPEPAKANMPERRRFLTRFSALLGGLTVALGGFPLVGFLFSPLIKKTPRQWRSVGPVDKFHVGQTVAVSFTDATPLPWAGVSSQTAAWLRRVSEDEFIAFSVNCTHLGCPVRWLQDAGMFLCPCHGGVYYADGKVAAGPPPLPLGRYPARVRNGHVEIQTSPIPITPFSF
jgi:menaquinol-cytochrome c reductase iron-sulfur subunit